MTRHKPGSKKKIGDFLRQHVGEVVTVQQLQEAAGPRVTEWARRLRDLRAEGWKISSHNDRADLIPGQYVLEETPPEKPAYSFSKPISARLRAEVLDRNGFTCQSCGAGIRDADPDNPNRTVRLHVGHIMDRSHGGKDTLSNLRALCSSCNQGAKNLVSEPPRWTWLLGQLRRASSDDQKKAYEWLRNKFKDST